MNFALEKPPREGDRYLWLLGLWEKLSLTLSNIGEENLTRELLSEIRGNELGNKDEGKGNGH